MGDERQYRYYRIGASTPIRVIYNKRGSKIGADVPDPDTGALVIRPTMLSRIEEGSDVEEIRREEFEALCAAVYAEKDKGLKRTAPP